MPERTALRCPGRLNVRPPEHCGGNVPPAPGRGSRRNGRSTAAVGLRKRCTRASIRSPNDARQASTAQAASIEIDSEIVFKGYRDAGYERKPRLSGGTEGPRRGRSAGAGAFWTGPARRPGSTAGCGRLPGPSGTSGNAPSSVLPEVHRRSKRRCSRRWRHQSLTDDAVRSKAGWAPFAGKQLHGRVTTTLVRGQPVIVDCIPVNPERPGGKFLSGPGATSGRRNGPAGISKGTAAALMRQISVVAGQPCAQRPSPGRFVPTTSQLAT